MAEPTVDVLVVGSGPTGLAAAGEALFHGATVRVIEAHRDRIRASRAFAVQARTLELFDRRGLASPLIARGLRTVRMRLHLSGNAVREVRLQDIGALDTRFPFLLMASQVSTEEVLEQRLVAEGGRVERDTTLVRFDQDEAGVTAIVRGPDGVEAPVRARYLVGADGAHSTVRSGAGFTFDGDTYPQTWVLADLAVDGPLDGEGLHFFYGPRGVCAFIALGDPAPWRLMAIETAGPVDAAPKGDPTLAELEELVHHWTPLDVRLRDLVWSSRFKLHHRMASRFRDRRVFLCGDAAHVHSPAGGQGMNTGIQDAWNLGWKLAAVVRGQAPTELLDAYEAERMPVAAEVLRTTDRAFTLLTATRPASRILRRAMLPLAAGLVARSRAVRRRVFGFVSQLGIRYRASPAVDGDRGRALAPGDRLPDVALPEGRLHERLVGRGYHLLVCDPVPADLAGRIARYGERVTEIRLSDGTLGGGVLLVRPDGYLAYAGSPEGLPAYLDRWLVP